MCSVCEELMLHKVHSCVGHRRHPLQHSSSPNRFVTLVVTVANHMQPMVTVARTWYVYDYSH